LRHGNASNERLSGGRTGDDAEIQVQVTFDAGVHSAGQVNSVEELTTADTLLLAVHIMYVFICQNTHDKTIKADSVA